MSEPKITKRQAIKECKELWAKVEETGLDKFNTIHKYFPHMLDYVSHCPLCEYIYQEPRMSCLLNCPITQTTGKTCNKLGWSRHTPEWFTAVKNL